MTDDYFLSYFIIPYGKGCVNEKQTSRLSYKQTMLGGRGCGPLTPNPFLYRGSHAAFGGRSWRRQPISSYVYDALS